MVLKKLLDALLFTRCHYQTSYNTK